MCLKVLITPGIYSEFGGFFISLRVHPSHPYIGAFTDPPIHSGTINIDH